MMKFKSYIFSDLFVPTAVPMEQRRFKLYETVLIDFGKKNVSTVYTQSFIAVIAARFGKKLSHNMVTC